MIRAALASLLLVLAAAPHAVAGPADVRLLPGWREAPRHHVAAVEIAMPPGWHTYWRVPGAAGIPPTFDWSGSSNLRRAVVEWPHPEVFDTFGFRTIGYHDQVVLPVLIEAADPSRPVELVLSLSYGVCRELCIPAHAAVTASLAADGRYEPEERAAIERALARRARAGDAAGISDAICNLAPNGPGLELAASVRLGAVPATGTIAVIEAAHRPDLWIGEAQASLEGMTLTARAPVESAGALPVIDRSRLQLTLIGSDSYVEIDGCRAPD